MPSHDVRIHPTAWYQGGFLVACMLGVGLFAVGVIPSGFAQTPAHESPPSDQVNAPVGKEFPVRPRRIPWTTSRIYGSPDPPLPYEAQLAFPGLKFLEPVTITSAPGTTRLFVVQRNGQLFSFPDSPDCEVADLFGNLKSAMPDLTDTYGMTFHPQYPERPFVYVCYILENDTEDGSVIARFDVHPTEPPQLDLESQKIIFRWKSGGHNGCSIKFGPDGYLYFSTGDGTGPNPPDTLRAGQDVSNVLSCILRIDVENGSPDRPYAIPEDNPFIDLEGVRPEIWSYGFRNPWKMSFDRTTGDLWVGDVGWQTWELVYRVQRGGNYGWSVTEGTQSIHPNEKRGPTPILPPVMQHDHSEARSITGGFVYHGQRLTELQDAYVYGDYSTGKIWALWYDGVQVTKHLELADTPYQIVAWGETNDGELFFLDHARTNQIYRLVPNRTSNRSEQFPTRLSETGLFSSVREHLPAAGVVPYSVQAGYWADGTQAIRWMALPCAARIQGDLEGEWVFPDGTVFLRTVVMPADAESAGPLRRLETQILHRENDSWRPYSYHWNDVQDDADLVPAEGLVVEWDARRSAGSPRNPGIQEASEQHVSTWRIASRSECAACHTANWGAVLGVNLRQTNVGVGTDSPPHSQLADWYRQGLLEQRPSDDLLARDHLTNPYDESADLNHRARSYLHANCAHCHRPGGGGNALIQLDFSLPLAKTKTLNQQPTQGTFDLPEAAIISPGDPFRSVLFYRLAKFGPGRMPHLGSLLVDDDGLRLIHDWIDQITDEVTVDTDAQPVGALPLVTQQELLGPVEGMLAATDQALQLAWHLRSGKLSPETRNDVLQLASKTTRPQVRDLFESFLPEGDRKQRLGVNFDPDRVLSLQGDVLRGRNVYWNTDGMQCKTCHRVYNRGGDVGPDLSVVGKKYEPAALLDTLRRPSAKIEPLYQAYNLITKTGQVHTGRLLQKSDHLLFKTAENQLLRVPATDVEELAPSPRSLMPERLLQGLSPQEAADLLAYLLSLRADLPDHQ